MHSPSNKPEGYAEMWTELSGLVFFPVQKRRFACVSADDASLVTRLRWRLLNKTGKPYVIRTKYMGKRDETRRNGRRKDRNSTVYIHRLLTGSPVGLEVDHKNGNPLNNHRANLRVATHADNMKNYRHRERLTGVAKMPDGRYRAVVSSKKLGFFTTEDAACAARDEYVQRTRGEFAFVHGRSSSGRECVTRNKSGYRGVYPLPSGFQVMVSGRHVCCKPTAVEGAIVYDVAALRTFGDRAKLNFPDRRPEYLKQIESEKQSA